MIIDEAIKAAMRDVLREELPAALAEAIESQAGAGHRLLNKKQIAQALGISERSVDTLRTQGLPTVWVVESPRFEFAAVVDWLKTRKAKRRKRP